MTAGEPSQRPHALHVERYGEGGPPVMLLHGFGASGFTWRHWVPPLARNHRLSVVDLKGFGASPKPRDGRYSPRDHSDMILALVRGNDLEGVTLVGHSLGGGIALLVALRLLEAGELDRLRGLVLVASAAFPQRLPPFIAAARVPALGAAALAVLPTHAVVRWILRAIVFEPSIVTEDMVRGYATPLADPDGRYGVLATARDIVPADVDALAARFPELDLPVQLLWGDRDRVVPPWVGLRLLDALPDARLEVLQRCGHLPAEERPLESLACVRTFLERVGPP